MRELVNYSIETDHTVLLVYSDGWHRRVPVARLSDVLSPADLAQVSAGLKLRRDFLSHHMPKAAFVLAAGSAAALLAVAGQPLAMWWTGAAADSSQPQPSVTPTSAIVRSQPGDPGQTDSEPLVQPAATPTIAPAGRAQLRPGNSRPARAQSYPAGTGVHPVTPSPKVPLASLPSPTPSPLPDSGDVLGDGTGPIKPTPVPSPQPSPRPSPEPLPTTSPSPAPSPVPLPPPTAADKNGQVL